ncbi:hypothetical protein LSAT2_023019 [Lamellibrachia satsuma]|nr:hypothetical protein LSAT2_023019 [Lamellibrachia satsuma]
MAPTKPLVAQQIEACYNIMGIPEDDTAEMTGAMHRGKRSKAWQLKRVFYLTPQVLMNDISSGTCPARLVRCLVVDEAHKAIGNHAYCQVVKELAKYKVSMRILALSATPGTDIKEEMLTSSPSTKREISQTGNYRVIALLCIAGKILTRVLLNRLLPLTEEILPETQCDFRPSRGTTDMIFVAQQIQEKCREQNQELFMAFIDLTRAFESINREALWKVLSRESPVPESHHQGRNSAPYLLCQRHRAFDDHNLRKETTVMVYKAVCIITLLYGSEAWVTYRCHLKTLETIHQHCLRKMLHIQWEDCRTNASVLTEAITTSIEAMIVQNQLRWTGHCVRMPGSRLPRQVLFSQLTHGLRTCGGQRKRLKDTAKHYMKKGHININTWEDMDADRLLWRRSIHQAPAHFETDRLLHEAEKRQRRKEREMSQHLHIFLPLRTSCPHSNKICKSRIGLLSHLRNHSKPLAGVILISRDR